MRAGTVARGLTYGIIGALALALALGAAGGSETNQPGTLGLIAKAPLGKVALIAVAIGLLALSAIGTGPEGGEGTKPPSACETSPAESSFAASSPWPWAL